MKRILTLVLVLVMANHLYANSAYTGMRTITALELTADMEPGVNLWNTLDATCGPQEGLGSENCWGNPTTTLGMISDIKERGYKTLRLPVTWYNHMGAAPNYTITTEWMDRVEEVANYAFQNDMYVIINIHHDDYDEAKPGSWLSPTYTRKDASIAQLEKVWTQIATRFKDYGDHLIFETMNEPRAIGTPQEWSGGSAEHRDVVNQLNLAAVNTIRGTGGNNASRFIMTPQIAANGQTAIQDLIIPNNDEKIIVSIHNYNPFSFTLQDPGVSTWGTSAEVATLQNEIKSFYDNFISKGRAVIIGEWGAADKNNLADRVHYYEVYAAACKQYQVMPINWIYSYQRSSRTWKYPALEDALFAVYGETIEGAPTVAFNNITDGDFFITGSDISIAVDAADEDGNIVKVDLFLNDVLVRSETGAPYLWNDLGQDAALNNLSAGSYTLIAEATDNDDKVARKVISIEVLDPISIPGVIEAEDFVSQNGIQSETTTDEGGGSNIGYIENSDWSSYIVDVSDNGIYEFTARVASDGAGGSIDIEIDDVVVGELIVDGNLTNGWQDWYTTESFLAELSSGMHTVKLIYKGGASFIFNLNWVEVKLKEIITGNSQSIDIVNEPYPTVTNGIVYLPISSNEWTIFNAQGIMVKSTKASRVDLSDYSKGLYLLKSGNVTAKVYLR